MRLFGWGLIFLFGGGMLYLLADWVVRSLNGYYVGGEVTTALFLLGVAGMVALIPIGIGIWLVRRDAHHIGPTSAD